MAQDSFVITTFYNFVKINDIKSIQLKLLKACSDNKILGTILLASEGINASLAGSRNNINALYNTIKEIKSFRDIIYKETEAEICPFAKLKISVKPEIIKFGVKDLDVKNSGKRVNTQEWEALLNNDAIVIDTRNDYEIAYGTFKNSINPNIRHFTDLAKWLDNNLKDCDANKPIAMFCTAGIRCDKATAYLIKKGFKNVYHLAGGVISYFIYSDNKKKYWEGDCFVFDDRIALDTDLKCY